LDEEEPLPADEELYLLELDCEPPPLREPPPPRKPPKPAKLEKLLKPSLFEISPPLEVLLPTPATPLPEEDKAYLEDELDPPFPELDDDDEELELDPPPFPPPPPLRFHRSLRSVTSRASACSRDCSWISVMGCGCAKAGVLERSSKATVNKSSENLIVYEVNKVSLDQKRNKKVDVVGRGNNVDVSAGRKLLAPPIDKLK
jgi:hypothetical protein